MMRPHNLLQNSLALSNRNFLASAERRPLRLIARATADRGHQRSRSVGVPAFRK